MTAAMTAGRRGVMAMVLAAASMHLQAGDLVRMVGPALGTSYRITLAEPPRASSVGEVHREVERRVAAIERATSGWRQDSDLRRFQVAAAGEWVEVGDDLAAVIEIAQEVHRATDGAFDITAEPLLRLWRSAEPPTATAIAAARARVGMPLVELRPATAERPPALRASVAGVDLDLGGIGPGYAVDRIGERLVELGSSNHLVELGGEVRAWGERATGMPWRVGLRGGAGTPERTITLASGQALATATLRVARPIVDPRTGECITAGPRSVTVTADACAVADAWAVAALVLDLTPAPDGFVSVPSAPSMPADRSAARPEAP